MLCPRFSGSLILAKNSLLSLMSSVYSALIPVAFSKLGTVSLSSQVGQTISLIPLFGPATGITTKGLKWELGASTVNKLDRDFVGISNVSMETKFSVNVTGGVLLCVINREHIDQEMVKAKKTHSQLSGNEKNQKPKSKL